MPLQTWWIFVVMTFVVSATPGPNMLLVMSHGARFGLQPAIWTMAGCMTALIGMVSISAAGVGALLHNFPAVFDALRFVHDHQFRLPCGNQIQIGLELFVIGDLAKRFLCVVGLPLRPSA